MSKDKLRWPQKPRKGSFKEYWAKVHTRVYISLPWVKDIVYNAFIAGCKSARRRKAHATKS